MIATDSGGGDFKPVPSGMHLARCYRIIDLGTQKTEFQGQSKMQRKIIMQFEVHGEDDSGKPIQMDDGKPMSISKNYTLSLAEKATLRADLQSWRGRDFRPDELRGFELKNVLGAWAMISVVQAMGNNGKEYTNIVNVNSVPAMVKKNGLPKGHNELLLWSFDDPNMQVFETFSNNIKTKIQASPEYKAKMQITQVPQRTAPEAYSGFEDMDSDLPF
jgi:hypothetical protein